MDKKQKSSSRKGRAKTKRQEILARLNSNDPGISLYDREQEERRDRGIDVAREKERRPEPGTVWSSGY